MKIERGLKVVVNKNPNLTTCGRGPKLIDALLDARVSADGEGFMFTNLVQYGYGYITNTRPFH